MVATLTEGLGAIFAAADANGGDIAAASAANGKVTTLKNATRQYKKHCARRPKRAAAERTAKPAVARKPSVKKNLRLPLRFVEEAAASASTVGGLPASRGGCAHAVVKLGGCIDAGHQCLSLGGRVMNRSFSA